MNGAVLQDNDEAVAAQAELERRAIDERCRYYAPHGGVERKLLQGVFSHLPPRSPRTFIVILRASNSYGKSALVVNLAEYLGVRLPNPYFDAVPYLREFKQPKNRGRIYTTPNAAQNTYPDEFRKWFPVGRWSVTKGGKHFDCNYAWDNGSFFDFVTFDQDPMAGESITLDWAIVDEPMSHRHWSALKTRFRFGGIIFMVLTPLEGATWYSDVLEVQERLNDDVFVVQGHFEDACIEHGVRGFISHQSFLDMFKDCDESELVARQTGEYLSTTGKIYGTYRTGYTDADGNIIGHEPPALEGYYLECWHKKLFTLYNIVDPHDRKPFAIGWYAVFPNNDVFTVCEWPDTRWKPYHKLVSCTWTIPDYVRMTRQTEAALGKDARIRLGDPNFMNAPKSTTKTTTAGEFANPKNDPRGKGLHYMFPPDSIEDGHIAVKGLLGDPARGIRPKFFNLAHCRNHCFALPRYGYRENRDERSGLSVKPELMLKDMPDLVRYGAAWGFRYMEDAPQSLKLWRPKIREGSTYRGA